MGKAEIEPKTFIDDNNALKLARLAEKFYSDLKNVQGFSQWHLKTYGCLPGEVGESTEG